MLRILLAAAVLVAAPGARAGDDHVFHYGFVEAGYEHQDPTDTEFAANGFSVGASLDLSDHVFFGAGYSSLLTPSFTDGGAEGRLQHRATDVTLGAHAPLGERADVSASVGYAWAELRGVDGFSGDPPERHEGITGALGLHVLVVPHVTFSIGPGYSYISREPGWDGSAGLTFDVTRRLWLDAGYWAGQDQAAGWSVTLRTMLGHDD